MILPSKIKKNRCKENLGVNHIKIFMDNIYFQNTRYIIFIFKIFMGSCTHDLIHNFFNRKCILMLDIE